MLSVGPVSGAPCGIPRKRHGALRRVILRAKRLEVPKPAERSYPKVLCRRHAAFRAVEDGKSDIRSGKLWQLFPGEMLQGKYTIQRIIGSGSNATAYEAQTTDGRLVAIKALSLKGMKDWKQLDMFQREGKVLEGLDHPGIPNYIDYFEEDNEKDRSFYIVQELAQGRSLYDMISSGMRANEDEAARIGVEVLKILAYLGGLRPPVVHRDIKPENIVIEGGKWGGRVYLIDFGGVQGVAAAGDASSMASTVVGTYGYMAPEQFRGEAQTSSDLYSLGATLLFLLTGQAPSSFPQERMRIKWRDGAAPDLATGKWARLLDGLLEPVAEDRLSAAEALAVLEGKQLPQKPSVMSTGVSEPDRVAYGDSSFRKAGRKRKGDTDSIVRQGDWMTMSEKINHAGPLAKPAGSRVILERSGARLDVTIPPKGLTGDTAFTGVFAVAWNAFVAFWTVGALASGGILFALFSAPFWFAGAQLANQAFGSALMRERMAIGRNKFRIAQELALLSQSGEAKFEDGNNQKQMEGPTSELIGSRVVMTMIVNGVPQTAIELLQGVNRYKFGEGLELIEQQWIVQQINEHLKELKGLAVDVDSMPTPEEPKFFTDNEQRDPFNDRNDPFYDPYNERRDPFNRR